MSALSAPPLIQKFKSLKKTTAVMCSRVSQPAVTRADGCSHSMLVSVLEVSTGEARGLVWLDLSVD